MKGVKKVEDFGDTIVTLEYGSKTMQLPFSIKLRDFQLDRYPGSMAPSSYVITSYSIHYTKLYE